MQTRDNRMKFAVSTIAANISCIVCVCAAFYLAANRLDGWGWFLMIAIFLSCTVKTKDTHET